MSPTRIQPNYMDNQHDVDTIRWSMRSKDPFSLLRTQRRSKVSGKDLRVRCSRAANTTSLGRSDKYWECFARYQSVSLHHIVGTSTMGAEGSPGSVVDTKLRVIGVTGLRVIDVSVMPRVPIGNTNAATVMIAERGAELIINLRRGSRLSEPLGRNLTQ